MSELPSGTVTLLFIDIEGSTTLVRELAGAWPDALDTYRTICRQAWAEFDGHELGTEGDSFFVVFATAGAAVHAAERVQIGLTVADWPMARAIRARIGIHSGSPQRHDDGYVGMDVHRAARVAASAHGGQIVVSEAAKALTAPDLGLVLGLSDLGEHRLKDIPDRMRLFQLTAPDLEQDFPPLRSQGAAGSLPKPATPTVGREGELAELTELLLVDRVRLVTLTGPGGTGKTRLATALTGRVAGAFPDGVYLVELATVTTTPDMWSGVAQVLDVPADGHIPPGFFDYVASKHVLLVLDNLEQIPDADHVVRDLLREATHISIVATSRRPLHVEGEFEHAVPPLLLPTGETLEEIEASGAVAMFVQHAARVRRGFALETDNAAAIAQLCVSLDGLPLAIELAAARVKMMSPAAILTRTDRALDISSSDRSRADRQRTLRGAIEWSYDLLDKPHKCVLNHLGIFEGGAEFAAIEAVVPQNGIEGQEIDEILFDLVDTSLVKVLDGPGDQPRFTLLETIKQFAIGQLGTQYESARVAHAQHFYDRAKILASAVRGRQYAESRSEFLADLSNYRAVIERGTHDIREPIDWPDGVPVAHVVRLMAGVADGFGLLNEAVIWYHHGLEETDAQTDPVGYAMLTQLQYRSSRYWGADPTTLKGLLHALELLRTSGALETDSTGGVSESDAKDVECLLVIALGNAHIDLDLLAAGPFVEEAMRLASGRSAPIRGRAEDLAYSYAYETENFGEAYQHLESVGRILESEGDPRFLTHWQNNMADLELVLGRRAEAQARLAGITEDLIGSGNAIASITAAETFGAIIGPEHPLLCARVFGAAEIAYTTEAMPRDPLGDAAVEEAVVTIRPLVHPTAWEAAWQAGRSEGIVDLLREMAALPLPPESIASVGN